MTDLTPEARDIEIANIAALVGDTLDRIMAERDEAVAALDAERARNREAESECNDRIAAELGWDGATTALQRSEARNRDLEAVVEAARRFERAFQQSLGSASATILIRDHAQADLRAALAVLEKPRG